MWNYIRRKLGIDLVNERLSTISYTQSMLERGQDRLSNNLTPLSSGLGRVLAKLDPNYGVSDLDKTKGEESKKLGEEIIQKLIAEDKARKHGTGGI